MSTALLGLGRMGDGIARTLLSKGHPLTVWNRTASRALPLASLGARVVATAAEAVSGASVVLTMLSDDDAVFRTVEGCEGLLGTMAKGAVHVSLSTISVSLSRKLASAHSTAGHGFVAAPVFGRPAAAASGQLLIVVAGPDEHVLKARPVLDVFSRQVVVLGRSPEQANACKLAGNFLIASIIESLGEAFAFVRRHDIDAKVFLDTVNGGLLKSPTYDTYGTIVAEGRYSPAGFAMPLGLKDVRLVLQAADAAAVPMPLANLVHDRLLAAMGRGKQDLDWSAIALLSAEDAGLKD